MRTKFLSRKSRGRKGIASVIGGVIMLAILFTVVFGYFYSYSSLLKAYDQRVAQTSQERFLVGGASGKDGNMSIYVNNTGSVAITVVGIIVSNSSGVILKVIGTNGSSNPKLPISVNSGQNSPLIDTGVKDTLTAPGSYVIKVITQRGTTGLGYFPPIQGLTIQAVNSLIASGFGSLQMQFSTFNYYSYISGPPQQDSDQDYNNLCSTGNSCNGGTYQIDIAHPHVGSLLPETANNQVPLAFSINITNNDPSFGTLVLNSHTNIWLLETCNSAGAEGNCAQGDNAVSNPIFVFYVMNVASNGIVQSTSQGSFVPIIIPYGMTKTVYYGAENDLSQNSFASAAVSADDMGGDRGTTLYGTWSVFLLFSGTKVTSTGMSTYGQNIPFVSSFVTDNLVSYAQSPVTCSSDSPANFNLGVNNSIFSIGQINKIVLNAAAFQSVSATAPSGWAESTSNGVITWTGSTIAQGREQNFTWIGTAPSVSSPTQLISPLTVYWSSGTITVQQLAVGCYIG